MTVAHPLHEHIDSVETLILESGEATFICDSEDYGDVVRTEMKPGKAICIKKGNKHLLHAKTDAFITAVLVPPDAGVLK